jgi:midasin
MDIRRPLIDPVTNSLTGFVPYLDTFPFPFYLILRDMSALPTVLGDALRQWFELAANTAT